MNELKNKTKMKLQKKTELWILSAGVVVIWVKCYPSSQNFWGSQDKSWQDKSWQDKMSYD